VTDMPTAGSPATTRRSHSGRRTVDSRRNASTPDACFNHSGAHTDVSDAGAALDQFLAEGSRRRGRHTREEGARPADWADPDPAAILRLPPASHPIDRATRRLRNEHCRDAFLARVRWVCECLQDLPQRSLTREDVRAYPWHLVDADTAAAFRRRTYAIYTAQTTRNDHISHLRRVITQVEKAGLISPLRRDLVLEQLWTVAVGPSRKRRRLTEQDIRALMNACEKMGRPRAAARNTAIVAVFYTSGIRISELCRLQLDDWDRQHHALSLRETKNGRPHVVYLHPDAADYLERWHRLRGDQPGALFCRVTGTDMSSLTTCAVKMMLSSRREAAGIPPFGSHDFRRTFATAMLRRHDVALVGKLLNHTKTASTLIYDLAGEEEMRAAVSQIAVPATEATAAISAGPGEAHQSAGLLGAAAEGSDPDRGVVE
jgi:integrase